MVPVSLQPTGQMRARVWKEEAVSSQRQGDERFKDPGESEVITECSEKERSRCEFEGINRSQWARAKHRHRGPDAAQDRSLLCQTCETNALFALLPRCLRSGARPVSREVGVVEQKCWREKA